MPQWSITWSASAAAVSSSCLSPHWLRTTTSVLKTCSLPVVTSWKLQHLQGLLGNPWHLSTGSCWTVSCCLNIWVGKVSRRRWNREQVPSTTESPQQKLREGCHRTKELLTLLESRFVGVTCNFCKLQQHEKQISTSEEATLVTFGDAEVEHHLKAGATLQVHPPATDEHFHSALSKDRQTGDTSLVQHWLIQDTFQQSSLSFKNQVQDAETQIIQNAPVWLWLCWAGFFYLLHMMYKTYALLSTRQIRMHLLTASPCNQWTVPVFPKHHWLVHPHCRKFSGCKQATQTLLK